MTSHHITSNQALSRDFFTGQNAPGAKVVDIDTKAEIKHVFSVDTQKGEVVCAHMPLRVTPAHEVETYTLRYRHIAPIYGGSPSPCLFHCYGNLTNKEQP